MHKSFLFPLALMLAGCGATITAPIPASVVKAAETPAGQLFCSIQTAGGGAFVAGLVDAEASAIAPAAAPVAVIATGATKAAVDAACAAAATSTGAVSGVPVSPPPAAVPSVAITIPKS